MLLLDVTPLSLGVETSGKVTNIVITRNTPIPTKDAKIYYTTRDNQTSIYIKVYQGERARSTDNHLLGKFNISGIPPAPKGIPEIKECFDIDANGVLTVTSEILSTGIKNELVISNTNGRLSNEEIEKMI